MPRIFTRAGVFAACLSVASIGLHAAPQKANPDAAIKNLTKRVEVIVNGRLRPDAPGRARVGISLWNPNNRPVAGPLFVIVDDSGLEAVTIANHPEQTPEGKGVFEILPAGKVLLPHGMSPKVDLVFETPAGFTQEQANEFALATRVFAREGDVAATQEDEDHDFATRGKSYDQAELDRVMAIQEKHTPDLMKQQGVLGTALGEDSSGNLVVRIYTETRGQAKRLPGSLDGVDVDVKTIPGGFKTGPAEETVIYDNGVAKSKSTREKERAESGVSGAAAPGGDPTIRFERPVPIGVSAFNASDVCAAGTLGARCIDSSGKLYAISNTHVFARLSSAGIGEQIVQPSQGDNNCDPAIEDNAIGQLVDFVPFNFAEALPVPLNVMDVALIEVDSTLDEEGNSIPTVGVATPEDGYGTPSSRVLRKNRIGLQVQKYGRTTIYTRGVTTGTNVISIIGFPPDPSAEFFKMDEYVGMLPSLTLSEGGDSGSLIVTLEDRRPVSILFAGGGAFTYGNPIGPVLDRFNVRIDDGTRTDATTGGDPSRGVSGRNGIAIDNLGSQDLGFLPPELWGRIKNPKQGLFPIPSPTTVP